MRWRLEVALKDFTAALKTLTGLARTKRDLESQAILSWEDPELVIQVGGYSVRMAARGQFPGQLRINARALLALHRTPPVEDPILIQAEPPDHAAIGPLTFKAACQSVEANVISLPVNPTLLLLLALAERHTEAEIERSGCSKIVADARARRDRLIDRATETLAPLEVDRATIAATVHSMVTRKGLPLV